VAIVFHQVFGARDRVGPAEEGDVDAHGHHRSGV
jgi:hypothetical protein